MAVLRNKNWGIYNSFDAVVSAVSQAVTNGADAPIVGDTARFRDASGGVYDATYTASGWTKGMGFDTSGNAVSSVPIAERNGIKFQCRPGSKGFRKFFGRMADYSNDLTNGTTFQLVTTLEQDFDAIQLVIATIQTSGTTVRSAHYVNVCADASLTDAQLNALSGWVFTDWPENDGNTVHAQFASFASATSRPRYLVSNMKAINSIPRTDGGTLPLIVVRSLLYNVNATPSVCGNGSSDAFANIASTDGRVLKVRKQTNNGLTTFSGADTNQSPLVGIIYYSRGRVVNIAKFGDSIMQGRGTRMGDGYIRPEAIRRSSKSGIAYEVADFAWSGFTSANYHNIAVDALGQFPIDIGIYPATTPNDVAGGASLATATANIAAAKYRHEEFVAKCRDNAVVPMVSTFEPVATNVNDYTLCDSARTDFNTALRALPARGVLICDTDAVIAGATVNGQVQPVASLMVDGIHPNDAGNELIRSQQFAPQLDRITLVG